MDLERKGKIVFRVIYVCGDCEQSEEKREGNQRWYRCGITNEAIDYHIADHGFPKACPLQDSH
jgi:hypothetical protein